jgi:hypothetical protein
MYARTAVKTNNINCTQNPPFLFPFSFLQTTSPRENQRTYHSCILVEHPAERAAHRLSVMPAAPDTKEGQMPTRKDSDATTLVTLTGARGPMQQDTQVKDIEAQTSSSQSNDERASKKEASKLSVNPRVISDAILGLSDGLTVPFALTAGLSAFGNARLVVLGGLAELIAGAISMGLGGFVGAKSEA